MKADEEVGKKDWGAAIFLLIQLKNILHSFSSNVEVYINNLQLYNSDGIYAHKAYISKNFKGDITDYNRVVHRKVYDYAEFFDQLMEAHLSETFSQGEGKNLVDPMVFCCMLNWGFYFFSTSELL